MGKLIFKYWDNYYNYYNNSISLTNRDIKFLKRKTKKYFDVEFYRIDRIIIKKGKDYVYWNIEGLNGVFRNNTNLRGFVKITEENNFLFYYSENMYYGNSKYSFWGFLNDIENYFNKAWYNHPRILGNKLKFSAYIDWKKRIYKPFIDYFNKLFLVSLIKLIYCISGKKIKIINIYFQENNNVKSYKIIYEKMIIFALYRIVNEIIVGNGFFNGIKYLFKLIKLDSFCLNYIDNKLDDEDNLLFNIRYGIKEIIKMGMEKYNYKTNISNYIIYGYKKLPFSMLQNIWFIVTEAF